MPSRAPVRVVVAPRARARRRPRRSRPLRGSRVLRSRPPTDRPPSRPRGVHCESAGASADTRSVTAAVKTRPTDHRSGPRISKTPRARARVGTAHHNDDAHRKLRHATMSVRYVELDSLLVFSANAATVGRPYPPPSSDLARSRNLTASFSTVPRPPAGHRCKSCSPEDQCRRSCTPPPATRPPRSATRSRARRTSARTPTRIALSATATRCA